MNKREKVRFVLLLPMSVALLLIMLVFVDRKSLPDRDEG